MKKDKVRNLVNSAKLTIVLVIVSVLPGCEYNYHYHCPDCNEPKSGDCRDCGGQEKDTVWVVIEKPCDEKCDCNKNCGCGKKQCDCKKTQPKTQTKTQPKTESKPESKPEQKPEPECKTVTTTTYEHFGISGDANDVVTAAIKIATANEY